MSRMPKVTPPGRWYRQGGAALLTIVAAVSAVLSWSSLYEAASTRLGQHSPRVCGVNAFGAAFPLLLDALILAASWYYVGGVKQQRPSSGWRITAHAAIGGTIAANWFASPTIEAAPWHIVAPIVWSVVVELISKDALGQMRETRRVLTDRIPLRLWLSAPAESVRTSWRMARTGERSAAAARTSSDACAAAANVLSRTLPGVRNASVRRQITRRLWAGTILPSDVLTACGWGAMFVERTPDAILRASLQRAIGPSLPAPTDVPKDAGNGHGAAGVKDVERPSDVLPASDQTPRRRTSIERPSAAKLQVVPDVPSSLTSNELAVWSVMLDRGDMRRASIFAASNLSERGAKDALERLVSKGRVMVVSRGVYRSLDPTGLDVGTDAETDAEERAL